MQKSGIANAPRESDISVAESELKFLRNCWYVACWSEELSFGALLARTICDDPIVMWRDDNGQPHALYDRCPHRFAALSLGRLEDGALACGYHGVAFAPDGTCAHNPHGALLRSLQVRSYPMYEQYRAIWIWMGEPERADPSNIPDLPSLKNISEGAYSNGYLRSDASYLLYVDNLLDPSHADFLHRDTIGVGTVTGTKPDVEEVENVVSLRWRAENKAPLPLWVRLGVFEPEEKADRQLTVRWFPAAVISVEDSYTGAQADSVPVTHNNFHFITPETSLSAHYFFSAVRNYAVDDDELSRSVGRLRSDIFQTEDVPMIMSQQKRIGRGDIMDLNPILFSSDVGAVRARRILERLIAQENATSAGRSD